jgi:ceramide glucosyltransferase
MRRQPRSLTQWGEWSATLLFVLFLFDRLLKLLAVRHFFQQPAPPKPASWPSVTILSPITRGASNLPHALACRGRLLYPGSIQHLLICDERDETMQQVCTAWQNAQPPVASQLIRVPTGARPIATKIEKLNAALPHATGEVLLFVDDDVALRPTTLTTLIPYLDTERAGAVFGLACYTAWHNLPSSLMSAFVNGNALLSYIPLTYLTEPFTITGHCFALRRTVFDAAGGFTNMTDRIDDDHELARRLRRLGLRAIQSPLIYDVENRFATLADYAKQMRRWFVFPQQAMMPHLSRREQVVMSAGSLATVAPPLLTLLALLTRRQRIWQLLGSALLLLNGGQWWCETRYLGRRTPRRWWPLHTISALIAPLHIVLALVGRSEVTWRGQRLRLRRGGAVEFLGEA